MSYLPLRAHPTTLPLLLAASLDLFVTVLVPVEAEKAEAAVEAVETIEAVACPETFRDLITQQKKRQKITFNEESRKVVHGSFFTFLFSILYKTTTTQDPNFIVTDKKYDQYPFVNINRQYDG